MLYTLVKYERYLSHSLVRRYRYLLVTCYDCDCVNGPGQANTEICAWSRFQVQLATCVRYSIRYYLLHMPHYAALGFGIRCCGS